MKNYQAERNDFLKLIAIIAMAIDHIGAVFFPYAVGFRIIGRLALPVFAQSIANGYRHTSNLKNYGQRILIIGVVSQIPYAILFNIVELNILFLLFLGLGAIFAIDKKHYWLLALILIAAKLFPVDYGLYGLIMIIIFFLARKQRTVQLALHGANICAATIIGSKFIYPFQFFGILLTAYLPKNLIKVKISRNFFYWFYPSHLIILYIIKIWLN